ncbi:aspartic proteinase [Punctularia strigosozonata HHB-11173 SS5]|uniref:Aspartic proteinase n=1 Tax=Punctularia strigosozonata (strain HHB-11173) TaxID=741275 RepID=R7S582_PUNST|nr:aspartic proteinase [Punctularia strigosozonata HHB-11173 SS5]EIN04506.1 aspartic proteinase [Punctularia strigosozonata HHB-11173 SS5]
MFRSSALLSLLLLAIGGYATPVVREPSPVKLPFAVRFNNGTNGALNIIEADRARINLIKEQGAALAEKHENVHKRASYSVSVTNEAVTYIASIGVGSPATSYDLIIDTGSSNTWVGAGKSYVKTSTSSSTGKSVSVSYGSGSFSGTEYTDTVTISSNLVITKQSIGVASRSSGFSGVDGILGIGPTVLTEGTLSGSSTTEIPTVTDNLYSQGTISTAAVGVYFAPTTVEETTNGELTFGGADTSKYTGTLSYVSLTSTSPAKYYWGINQSIKYGSTSILSSTAGIVDTGTTLIYIATDAYNKYKSATGATLDSATGLLRITTSQYNSLSNLVFTIGSKTYTLTPNAQIWPRSLNSYIGGSSSYVYLVVNDIGSNTGSGLDFIDGYTFLERFYTVYDTTNSRFGIATTAQTTATTN